MKKKTKAIRVTGKAASATDKVARAPHDTSAQEIIWEDPPPKAGRGRNAPWIEKLQAKPNEWGVIKTYGKAVTAASSASYRRKSMGEEGFEFQSREEKLYARYVGSKKK
jgi:hypothetical protein